MCLSCTGPLACAQICFSKDTAALHNLWLVESVEAMEGLAIKLHVNYWCAEGISALTPVLFKGQLYRQRGSKRQGPEQRGDLGSKK